MSANFFNRIDPFDLIKWILGVAFGAGLFWGATTYETKAHAEETYVKKELFVEFQKNNEQQLEDIKALLKEIRDNQNKR